MKKTILSILFILMSTSIFCQYSVFNEPIYKLSKVLHAGMNYTPNARKVQMQFYATSAYPWLQHNRFVFTSEISYLGKRKGADLCGFKFQPANAYYTVAFLNDKTYRLNIGSNFGYLINKRQGLSNGFLVIPTLHCDMPGVDVKCSYDYDMTNKLSQFNVSATMSVTAIGAIIYGLIQYNN